MRAAVTAILWIIPFVLFAFAIGLSMALPSAVRGWKAQGVLEAPLPWQIGLDLSDFLLHRWFIWLPV